MPAPKTHTVRKNFRLTEREAACLSSHAAAAEMSESDYVRKLVTDPAHVFVGEASTLQATYRELKRQGVNLNQIAYAVNSGRARTLDADALSGLLSQNAAALAQLASVLDDAREARDANR